MNNSDDSKKGADAHSNESATRSNRESAASISDPVMTIGRDEMNLADLPHTVLASRPPKGATSLDFEDEVWDKHGRNRVKRRLTVSACSEFGLPTATDDEVILGLIQLTYATDFTDRKLSFTPAELFRVLGWRNEGRSYSRLENSLKRWVGVTLYYENAWRDNRLKIWMDEHFHLLDNVVIRRRQSRESKKACNGRHLPWTTIWNETVFKSFQDGYVRELDMGVFRRLKSAAAKRMYRFLDKRLYRIDRLTCDLRAFACERIGFSRTYDNSQLKRKLDEAAQELMQVGFLEPLPNEQRYQQVRRGEWKVTFILSNEWKQKRRKGLKCTPLEAVLMDRGIEKRMAAKLVRRGSHEAIRQCVREYDEMLRSGNGANLGNPPGLLVKKIWERISAKHTGRRSKHTTDTRRGAAPPPESELVGSEPVGSEVQLEAVRDYLAKMSSEERDCLEARALNQAPSLQIKCYETARRDGDRRSADRYRDMIVYFHVRDFLAQTELDT